MSILVSTPTIVLSELSYVQIQVVAEVTMPDVLSVDIVQAQDAITTKAVSKATSDTQALTDKAVRNAGKALADSQATVDAITRKGFSKARVDSVTPEEVMARTLVKAPFSDNTTPVDAPALEPLKAFSDTQGMGDLLVGLAFHKGLADSVVMEDVANAYRAYLRDFDDSFALPDLVAKDFVPPGKTENTTVSDASSLGIVKPQSDGLVLIDNMDGDIQYAVIKLIGELLSTSDTKAVDFNKFSTDNVTSSDAGTLSMQDYCDLSYFSQDYVGLARTF